MLSMALAIAFVLVFAGPETSDRTNTIVAPSRGEPASAASCHGAPNFCRGSGSGGSGSGSDSDSGSGSGSGSGGGSGSGSDSDNDRDS